MLKSIIYRKTIRKTFSLVLAVTMLLSLFIFDFGGSDNAVAAATPPDGIDVNARGKTSDYDTSNFTFSNTPNVNSGPALNPIANIFLNTPANDGRVWTDKSVNAVQAFIYDSAGSVVDTVRAPVNEFLVTLSALSQSINIEQIIVEPSDTVFVIDASGSMATNTVPGDGRSRVAVVIDALNDAINMLMAANPNNRVSVVIYGGQLVSSQNQAKVYPVLALGRYEITPAIFSVSGTTVTVNSAITNPQQRSFTVEGGTPTQLGMRRGADVLLGVTQGLAGGNGTLFDTGTPDLLNPGQNIIVTRKPNIILMTDGEPTYAWHDHTMSAFSNWQGVTTTANWYDVGNGSAGDMGLTTLTVITAAYVKQQVSDWYYPTNPSAPGYSPDNAGKSVGFYTLGLGVNSAISNAMLSPYGTSAGGSTNAKLVTQSLNNVSYDMLTALNTFAPGSSGTTFPYLQRGSSTARSLITVSNSAGYIQTCNYDTMSFTAMDKAGLDEAFNTITQQIVTQGNYSTNAGGNPQYNGYLVFSDVIGEYMKFGDFYGLWYNNVKNDGSTFKTALVPTTPNPTIYTSYRNDLMEFLEISETEANDLISSSRAAGEANGGLSNAQNGNKVVYYADLNRNFVSNAFDGFGNEIDPVPLTEAYAKVELYTVQGPALDALDGKSIDLMLIVFQVVTVLQDGNFISYHSDGSHLASPLKVGDQIVRWYIPASLIPLRGVKPVTNPDGSPIKDDFGFDVIQVSEASPLRVIYSVAPDFDKIAGGLTSMYSNANKSPTPNGYYFYANRWRGMDGTVSRTVSPTRNDMANMAQAAFQPSTYNVFYRQVLTDSTIVKSPNVNGPTGTSPWQWGNTSFPYSPTATAQVQRLGNNGRIEIRAQAEIILIKSFVLPPGLTMDQISPISFTLYGTDGTNEIFRANLVYPNDFTDDRVTIKVPPGTYTLHEKGGWAANYGLLGLMPSAVEISAGDSFTWFGPGGIVNSYFTLPGPHGLRIRKMFHGLLDGEVPPNFRMVVTTPGGFDLPLTYAAVTSPAGVLIPFTPGNMENEIGIYRIREEDPSFPGMVLSNVNPPLPYEFEVTEAMWNQNNELLFVANNFYTKPSYSIELSKVINPTSLQTTDEYGNSVVREPVDLTWKIERLGTDDAGGGFIKTIHWADLVNGKYPDPITDLMPGTYRITELGLDVPGFNGPSVSLTNNGVPVTLTPGPGTPPTSYSYTFTIDGDRDINLAFGFTNVYTVPPQPPPVTPPTGDDPGRYLIPVLAIIAGVLLIVGAEYYRRSLKKRKVQKNDQL